MPFTPDWRRIEVVDEEIAEILRKKTPAERLAIAAEIWRSVRSSLLRFVAAQHLDWTLEQVELEVAQRILHWND